MKNEISTDVPFEKLPEQSFLVTATGEAIFDEINVGKLPNDWHALDISKLVEPGFVHRARVDYLSKFGSRILTALVLTAGLSIMATLGITALIGNNAGKPTAPSTFEKLVTAPITFISGNYPSAPEVGSTGKPVLDFGSIRWQPRVQLTGADAASDWVTKAADLEAIIKMELAALEKTGKLDPKIATSAINDIRETWSTPTVEVPASIDANGAAVPAKLEGGKPDTFRVVLTDDNVFVFSIVLAPTDGGRQMWTPWSGVFHKNSDGKWSFLNLTVPGVPSYVVRGFDSVAVNDISNTAAKAFPLLVRSQK